MEKLFTEFGIIGGIVVCGFIASIGVMWKVFRLLFNEDENRQGEPKGFVPKFIGSHCSMVQEVKESAQANTKCLTELTTSLRTDRLSHERAHKQMASAAWDGMDAIEHIGKSLGGSAAVNTGISADKAKQKLGDISGNTNPPKTK